MDHGRDHAPRGGAAAHPVDRDRRRGAAAADLRGALHFQVAEFQGRPMSPFVRYQVESGMLMVGLYTVRSARRRDDDSHVDRHDRRRDQLRHDSRDRDEADRPLADSHRQVRRLRGDGDRLRDADVRRNRRRRVRGDRRAARTRAPRRPARSSPSVCSCSRSRSTPARGSRRSPRASSCSGLQGVAFMGGWLEQVSGFSQSDQDRDDRRDHEPDHAERVDLAPRGVRDADAARRFALVLAVRERVDPERRRAGAMPCCSASSSLRPPCGGSRLEICSPSHAPSRPGSFRARPSTRRAARGRSARPLAVLPILPGNTATARAPDPGPSRALPPCARVTRQGSAMAPAVPWSR